MTLRVAVLLAVFSTLAVAQEPAFVETGKARGLPEGFFGRVVFCDLDGDRWPDLVVDNRLVLRNVPREGGGRRFVEAPLNLVPEGAPKPTLVLFADLDDDGDRDAFVGWQGDEKDPKWKDPGVRSRIALLQDGRFVHQPSPELAAVETLVAGSWLDYDGDGRLDFVRASHYAAGGLQLEAFPLHLMRGLGGGRFVETTQAAGLSLRREAGHTDSRRPVYGLATGDWDGDGRTDIFVCAYGRQRNLLYRNKGDGTFEDVGLRTGFAGDEDVSGAYPESTKQMFLQRFGQRREDEKPFRSNGNTFDAACADFDNDGDLDVFLGEITHAWAGPSSDRSSLLVNQGAPTFRFVRRPDAAPRTHAVPNWNQGDLYAAWLDYDNDGWLDLLIGSGEYPDDQRLRLFRQHPVGAFTDVTAAAGIDWDMCTELTLADYDRDGDLDIVVGNSNNRLPAARREGRVLRLALWENRVGQNNHWLNVRLQGKGAAAGGNNRDGIGARIVVRAGDLTLTREIAGGRGHAGHNDALEASFGLGQRTRVDRIEVRWPNGRRDIYEGPPADRFLLLREGAKRAVDRGPH